jgi:hypothetical protein
MLASQIQQFSKKWVKPVFLLGCYGFIFHGTGNLAQLFQNFGNSGGFEPPNTPLGTPLILPQQFYYTDISTSFGPALLCHHQRSRYKMSSGSTKISHNMTAYTTLIEERSTQSKLRNNACYITNTNIEIAAMDIQQCVILYCCRATKYFNNNNNPLRSSCKVSDIFVWF